MSRYFLLSSFNRAVKVSKTFNYRVTFRKKNSNTKVVLICSEVTIARFKMFLEMTTISVDDESVFSETYSSLLKFTIINLR